MPVQTPLAPLLPLKGAPIPLKDTEMRAPERRFLGRILVDQGALSDDRLKRALALRARHDCLLSDILLNRGMVTEAALMKALQTQWRCPGADLAATPPDAGLVGLLPPERWLALQAIPWKRCAGGFYIACARPDRFAATLAELPAGAGIPHMALAQREAIHEALMQQDLTALVEKAERRVAPEESCRDWNPVAFRRLLLLMATGLLALGVLASTALTTALFAWAVLTLFGATVMKAAAASQSLRHVRRRQLAQAGEEPDPPLLPSVSILVPLYREKEIAARLIQRLQRLTYPRELLDICLVVEADDTTTRDVIAGTDLPRWLRVITVPEGAIRTKPRAMNFALDFCKGSIIGIYDAEDAPDPDQITRTVRRFHRRGPQVACLQGVLDHYNARTNWLSRCFTIEYAAWFRVILPRLQKLGLILPLGGTTLFVRREVLEALGAWDAHNVTEDADLGIRLTRHGYRTEFVETVTGEEANCRPVPWIRQRSHWLKGFAMTWVVHMRNPRLLIRQVGWWRFFGLQLLLPCALSQFLLAPLLWSLWLIPLGVPHPLTETLSRSSLLYLALFFVGAELLTVSVNMLGVAGHRHRHLLPWVPTMHLLLLARGFRSLQGAS